MARTGEPYTVAARRLAESRLGTLHVTNGDVTVEVMRAAGITAPILPWRDVLHDGPVPGGIGDVRLREIRAEFIAASGWSDRAAVLRDLTARDATLTGAASGTYVLWFEADLYDQLQLIQVLDRLARAGVAPDRITLVSVGEYPGIAHFRGLGQLEPAQLLALGEQGVVATAADLAFASAAWRAFTAPEPTGLPEIAQTHSPGLRFVADAFVRLQQEYPALSDGLSLLQRRILLAVEAGAATAGEVFAEVSRREQRPYLGDLSCWAVVRELATGRHPLLECSPTPDEFAARTVGLTDDGRAVLAGDTDQLSLRAIDRWIGGVHLHGDRVAWRFDDRRETVVRVG